MAGLSDLTLGQIGTVGGTTLGGLGIGKALEYSHDINKINQWANMGYGKGNPVPQHLRDTLKGSWVPNKTFEKMGLGPGSTKKWFFNTISDKHFQPVQDTIKFAKNIPGYAMKGITTLASLPAQAALMTLHSTPVNADEIDGFDMKAMMAKEALFKKKQKQANIFKQIKEKQLADAAAKAKADAAAAAAAAAAKQKFSGQGAQGGGGGANIGGGQQTSSGIAGGAVSHSAAKEARGDYEGWGLADGGIVNLYKYGGYLG